MSQQQTPAVPQQQPKSTTPTAPLPIDPSLLRHISGGATTSTPNPTW
jgi:hypothetical protein